MSSADRYQNNLARGRRTPIGDPTQSSFFQGQGGKPTLPPLSSAFPTSYFPVPSQAPQYAQPYTQPRSSPGRDHTVGYPWPNYPAAYMQPQQAPLYSYNEPPDNRYPTASHTNYTSRPPPDVQSQRRNSNMPLGSTVSHDRYQHTSSYAPSSTTTTSSSGNVRSPTTPYPMYPQYTTSHTTSYSYPPIPDPRSMAHDDGPLEMPMPHPSLSRSAMPRPERAVSAYTREACSTAPYPQQNAVANEEASQVKKKRKRADATQLEVLNEVYNRTAFPSTEERAAIAKKLDMTPRSVQIWFQNKRQSMRQSTRQPSTSGAATAAQQGYDISPTSPTFPDGPNAPASGYPTSSSSGAGSIYDPRFPDGPLSNSSNSPSARSSRSPKEMAESRSAWNPRGY